MPLLLALLVLAFAAAPAVAQTDDPVDEGPDTEVVEDVCDRGGADAQYSPCEPQDPCDGADDDYGADGAYGADDNYCVPQAAGGGGPPPPPKREVVPAVVRPAALQTLPLTGSPVPLIAAFGLSFLLAGAGLRLVLARD